jgi:dolichol-phosphate mannosyltransferase
LSSTLVIIPTYNERENIPPLLEKVFSLATGFHVLIVDDGSPDATASLVQELQPRYPGRLFLLQRSGKLGLGTAYLTGFKWGLEKGYQYLFEMDADFSHDPNDLPRLLEACEKQGADLSVGSRYVKGGGVQNWPFNRIALSKGASFYTRLITGIPGTYCYTSTSVISDSLAMPSRSK